MCRLLEEVIDKEKDIQKEREELKYKFDVEFSENNEVIKLIENKILEHSKPFRRKVAMIIMLTMSDIKENNIEGWENLEWTNYVFIIQRLVEKKKLTANGNIYFPRYSEVKLT